MTNYEVNYVHIIQMVRESKPEVPWQMATVVINLIFSQTQTSHQLPELDFEIFAIWEKSEGKNHI